ncbi:hypothetical protein ACS0TY_020059 [Phlomoides rotata]
MKHIVDLYNHSRKTAKVTTRVVGMTNYRTYRVSLSDRECDCGFFAPLPDIEEWEEPNFQLRHNPDRRIRRCGRDVMSRIHNEMDWAQTRAIQQYQAQDNAGPSTF